MHRRALLVGAVLLALVGCGEPIGIGSVDGAHDEPMIDYCRYGAVSRAQLEGCFEHVNLGDVTSRDTNAARYAKGKLDSCLRDAGPFCEER